MGLHNTTTTTHFTTLNNTTTLNMAADRVKSKNLFNFRPAGFIDADILAEEKQMKEKMGVDLAEALAKMQLLPDEHFAAALRGMDDAVIAPMLDHPLLKEAELSCDHSTLTVPTSHCGDYGVSVLVHTPKFLTRDPTRPLAPCIVYAHGGGAVFGSAKLYTRFLSHMALDCGVVVFNVDYRLAPETRCPNNVLDFYEVIKYVASNASELGIDPSKIAMAGESGGGYICAGAMVQLALKDESSIVKIAIPAIPMLDDYEFTTCRLSMTKEESDNALMMQKIWQAIAGPDFESKRKDPLLFPGKASPELFAKMPPTVAWEDEFDMYITPATRFAHKLRTAGRLLEFVCIPGAKHGSGMNPQLSAIWKLTREAWRVAIQEYLVKN